SSPSVRARNAAASVGSRSTARPSSSTMLRSATVGTYRPSPEAPRRSSPDGKTGPETTSTVAGMRAVIAPGDGTLALEERPVPQPGPGEVLVRVHGAGITRADLIQRRGFYPAPPGVPADI